MSTRDTSRDETGNVRDVIGEAIEAYRPQYERQHAILGELLARPGLARTLSDVEDPLEGCDSLCRSITYGRVGDPAGTHTRERNLGVTMMAFGYLPEWPREWMGSAPAIREDGEDEGHEVAG